MRKSVSLVLILLCVLKLVACGKQESSNTTPVFQAEILIVFEDIILVDPMDGYQEADIANGHGIGVTIHDLPNADKLRVGDIVEITYSELLTHQDIPSAEGVEKIIIIKPSL